MITPLLDNVVVQLKQKPEDAKTASGIIVPEAQSELNRLRTVIAVGPHVATVKVGDTVLMTDQIYKESFQDYQIVKAEHILAIISEENG